MENTKKMYITAEEAAEMLDVSMGYAYKIIRYKWQVKVQHFGHKKCSTLYSFFKECFPVFQAVALPVHTDYITVVHEPVQSRCHHLCTPK